MYFSEALSSTSNELQQVSSGRSLNELQARSARSKRKEIESDESLLCASRRGLSSDLPGAALTKRMGNQRKLFKNPCSQAELNKIVPFGFSLQRQKNGVFFAIEIV